MGTHPESVKLGLCSWRTLPVPLLLQLVHSSHASSLCLTRVLLARTTRTAGDAACAVSERLGPLLDPGSLAGTSFPVDATACAVSEHLGLLLDPGSMAGTNYLADALLLAQSPNASGLYSTRVPWQARIATPMLQLVQSPNASGFYSTRVPWQARTACAVSECLGRLLDPGFLADTNCPAVRCYSLCSDDSTHDVRSSTVLRLVAAPSSLEDVSPKVPGACAALKRRLLTYIRMRLYSSVWQ